MVIAGEVSGDMHASILVRQLQERMADIQFWGIGGERLRDCGVQLCHDVSEMAVLGVAEVLRRYPFFKSVFNEILEKVDHHRPDAAILVDYPGFNLRLAAQLKRRGVKVIYYICPQVWAWHQSRVSKIARIVDRLLVIFPFEVEVFSKTGLHVNFVGHPLVKDVKKFLGVPPTALPWTDARKVALLPGSRRQEVQRILPAMLETAEKMRHSDRHLCFLIAAPNAEMASYMKDIAASSKKGAEALTVIAGETREILRQADAAMVASGTATLETALIGCPMIVVYKTSSLTYWVGRMLIRVDYLGMVNLVAGSGVCPEFIQHDAVPEKMAPVMLDLLQSEDRRQAMLASFDTVRNALSRVEGPSAADLILQEIV